MKLTNGTVSFSRVAKLDDYGVNKKAEVSLSLAFEEGGDPTVHLEAAARIAFAQVEKMLGSPVATARKEEYAKKAEQPDTRNDATVKTAISAPAVPVEVAPAPLVVEVPPPAPLTDKELHAAATRKNDAIKNPAAIRALVAEFNPDKSKPFTMQQIPQARRKEFIDKLNELKPAAA